jgi:hypothetical protein
MTEKKSPATKVRTGLVRFSYLNAFRPTAMEEGGVLKYSVSLIIPKKDKAQLKEIQAAINAAKENDKGKWDGKIPAKLRNPLRDGDEDRPEDPNYANCYFITASSTTKPGIVDKDRNPITDEDEIYSGCYGRATINFFGYKAKGNIGIGAGLQNLQKIKDGERLGGRANAEDDFDDEFELDDDEDFG